MKNFFVMLFEKSLRAILDVDLGVIKPFVYLLWDDSRPGTEKRKIVIGHLRNMGSKAADFWLKIAIEYVLGKIEQELLVNIEASNRITVEELK